MQIPDVYANQINDNHKIEMVEDAGFVWDSQSAGYIESRNIENENLDSYKLRAKNLELSTISFESLRDMETEGIEAAINAFKGSNVRINI